MDPDLYLAMVKQWRRGERARNTRAALIVCKIHNMNRKAGTSALEVDDIIGGADE